MEENQNLTGITIKNYKIGDRIGKGGFGEVYKATDEKNQKVYAFKIIRLDNIFPQKHKKRFIKEAKILCELSDHPNIVKVIDFDIYNYRLPYIVMEYVPGKTLGQSKADFFCSYEEAALILEKIARALNYVHSKKIYHKDIKPSNILFDENGEPKIADFGIAKKENEIDRTKPSTSDTGEGFGTLEYMAPEQIFGGENKIDGKVDIYALGVVFFEITTGSLPYTGTPLEVRRKHLDDNIPIPSQNHPNLPQIVDQVIIKAMQEDPQNRFNNMGEFADYLHKIAVGQKIIDPPLVNTTKTSNNPEKKKYSLFAFWMPIIILLLFVLISFNPIGFLSNLKQTLLPLEIAVPAATISKTSVPTSLPTYIETKETLETQRIISVTPTYIRKASTTTATLSVTPTFTQTIEKASKPTPRLYENRIKIDNINNLAELRSIDHESVIEILWPSMNDGILKMGANGITYIDPTSFKITRFIPFDNSNNFPEQFIYPKEGNTIYVLSRNMIFSYEKYTGRMQNPIASLPGLQSFTLSNDGNIFLAGLMDHKLQLISESGESYIRSLQSGYGNWSVSFTPNDLYIASGTSQGVMLWDNAPGASDPKIFSKDEAFKVVAFSNNSSLLAGGSENRIHVWNVETGEKEALLEGKFGQVNAISFSPDDSILYSGSADNKIYAWDILSKKVIRTLKGHTDSVISISLSPLVRISVKAHSLNGGCRTLFRGERLTGIFYIKCATSTAATGSFFATRLRGRPSERCGPGGQGLRLPK